MKILTDSDKMPFGKYKETKMEDVPASYLHYLWVNGLNKENSPVSNYISENITALEMEHPDGIWR